MKVFSFLLLLVSSPALAADPPLSVTAFRDLPSGREQITLVFRGDQVELVANSDFLVPSGPFSRVERVIGLFYTAKQGWYADAETEVSEAGDLIAKHSEPRKKLKERVKRGAGAAGSILSEGPQPHTVRVFVREQELTQGTDDYNQLRDLLSKAQMRIADWKAQDGIAVQPVGPDRLRIRPLGMSQAQGGTLETAKLGCPRKPKEEVRCAVPGYGSVWLRP